MKKQQLRGTKIRFGSRVIHIPGTKLQRTILGVALCLGGIFSFLPVLGIWMLPLGILILSAEYHVVRRFRRRVEVMVGRWPLAQRLARRWRAWRAERKRRKAAARDTKTPPRD